MQTAVRERGVRVRGGCSGVGVRASVGGEGHGGRGARGQLRIELVGMLLGCARRGGDGGVVAVSGGGSE
jgi:hypothetical protein